MASLRAGRTVLATFRLLLLGGILLGVAAGAGSLYLGMQPEFSVATIADAIHSWGVWGVLGAVGLMVLHSFVPFPAEFLAVANGMVYGTVWGTAITWAGAMLGAAIAFGVARALGRSFVEALVARRDWHLLDAWTTRRGAVLVLASRLVPVIAFNLVNYAAGLSGISWWTFVWTTGVGILPMVTLMVVIGDYLEVLTWQVWLLLAGGVAVLSLALGLRLRTWRRCREG